VLRRRSSDLRHARFVAHSPKEEDTDGRRLDDSPWECSMLLQVATVEYVTNIAAPAHQRVSFARDVVTPVFAGSAPAMAGSVGHERSPRHEFTRTEKTGDSMFATTANSL
jgi:hypothetical protein